MRGKAIPLSPARRLVGDLMRFSIGVPRVTVQRRDCKCRATKRTLKLTKTPRRLDSKGMSMKVTVSLSGFFFGEIPYRGLTLVRTLS